MDEHSVIGGPGKPRRAWRARLLPLLVAGLALGACDTAAPNANLGRYFEVIAHQGGRGLFFENSVAAFKNSLAMGVNALALDLVSAKEQGNVEDENGYVAPALLVWSGLAADASKCEGKFVGWPFKLITFAQAHTIVCDKASARFPGQQTEPGNKIALLRQVLELVDDTSKFNFDIQVRTVPNDGSSSTPEQAIGSLLEELKQYHQAGQVRLKSFDWRDLELMRQRNPQVRLVALYDEKTFFAASPWLGPVDYSAVGGDPVKAAQRLGAVAISPCYTTAGCAGDEPPSPGSPLIDRALVDRAHAAGVKVLPWTVNDEKSMAGLVDLGVDGIVTDYPDKLRDVLKSKGVAVPDPYKWPPKPSVQKRPPGFED